MTQQSANGWPTLTPDSRLLHDWKIPTDTGEVVLTLRRGRAGFVLAHWCLWFSEAVEPVHGLGDDFGYADRFISGTAIPSNHWSGTAEDLNSSKHRSGVRGTFTKDQTELIEGRLPSYNGVIKWGGHFRETPDEMHYELEGDMAAVQTEATWLMKTRRGQRVLAVNPRQKRWLP